MKISLEEQIEFYNDYWGDLKKFGSYKLKRISKIISYLDFARKYKKNPSILDLGCGDGRCCAIWNEIGPTTGFDLSVQAVANAKKRYPFIDFYAGDANKTSFPDSSFDIIISQEVIEHIEHQEYYISECKRLLTSEGILILTTPNKYYFDRRNGGNYSRQPIENLVTIKDLKKLLSESFEILSIESFIHPKGDSGIYKILDNRLLVGFFSLMKLDQVRVGLRNRLNLGLNIILMARRKA